MTRIQGPPRNNGVSRNVHIEIDDGRFITITLAMRSLRTAECISEQATYFVSGEYSWFLKRERLESDDFRTILYFSKLEYLL